MDKFRCEISQGTFHNDLLLLMLFRGGALSQTRPTAKAKQSLRIKQEPNLSFLLLSMSFLVLTLRKASCLINFSLFIS